MVTPQHENSFRVFNFVSEKKTERLDALLSPIDVVSQEQVISIWRGSCVIHKPKQVIKLAMNV